MRDQVLHREGRVVGIKPEVLAHRDSTLGERDGRVGYDCRVLQTPGLGHGGCEAVVGRRGDDLEKAGEKASPGSCDELTH